MAVSVRTGKVEVDMPESVMRLLPNEQIIVNNTNGEILKKNEDAQKVTAWLQGGLYFNRTPISSVIHDLERMYNQEIVLDPNVVFDDYIYGEHDNKSLEADTERNSIFNRTSDTGKKKVGSCYIKRVINLKIDLPMKDTT